MCFLPITALKLFVSFGALISGLLSLGVLALTIYVNVGKSQIIDSSNKQFVNDILISMYIISIFFLFLSLCGIYGAIKTKKESSSKAGNCLLSIYSIGVILFLVIFFILLIVAFVAPKSIFGESCQKGQKTQLIEQLNKINVEAQANFCSKSCPCYLNQTNANSDLANYLKSKNMSISNNKVGSYFKYQDCMSNTSNEESAGMLAAMEQYLDCGGWCANPAPINYLKFTDINLCTSKECYTTKKACYEQFKGFVVGYGNLIGAGCTIAAAICLGNMIMICCLCYHPKKKDRKVKNFYARMMDD